MTRPRIWTGFRSVLCPIDFSEHSRCALQYAVAIARRGRKRLRVLYVNDLLLVAAASAALHDRHLVTRSAGELKDFVDASIPANVRAQIRLSERALVGDPADQILKDAGRRHTDLIVLGTHGLTGADRLFMGSTTLSILQRTTVPVLAVPRSEHGRGAALSPSWPGQRIVAALELDTASAVDVEAAARIALWFNSSLLLLHVISEIPGPAWLRDDLSAHDRIRVAQAQQRMDTLAARARRWVKTESQVTCGRVPDEIAALAAVENAGLVVSALRDRRGWFGARRGSVSYHVLSHAVTPVLAYPSQWRPR